MKGSKNKEKSASHTEETTRKQLAEAGDAYDGRPNSLPVRVSDEDGRSNACAIPGAAGYQDESQFKDDPYQAPMNSYDEKRYRQYWRLAAAEELDELSDHSPDSLFNVNDVDSTEIGTPDSGIQDFSLLDPATRALVEEEWRAELSKIEEEILTLKQVLYSKTIEAQKLKRKLGITAWKEFKVDMGQGFKNIQDSIAYQKTSSTLKVATVKTTSTLGSLGTSVSKKLEDVKNSITFKSFEEKVGTAYSSVKTKVSSSRSSSMNNFKEVLLDSEENVIPTTTPTVSEDRPITT